MNKRGFTLVELLVTIAILGVVITIATISLISTGRKAKIRNFNNKLDSIINYAKINVDMKNVNEKEITITRLIDENGLEVDGNVFTNDMTGQDMGELRIKLYKKNQRVMACINSKDSVNKGILDFTIVDDKLICD